MSDAPVPARSIDLFHRSRFSVVQPIGSGHRAGLDAMLLAATVPPGFSGICADLGAGCGAAGLAVLSRCPQARTVLVERDEEMVACAQATLALDANVPLAGRARVLQADVTLRGRDRSAAGLKSNAVDFAIMNPPFNAVGDRASPDPRRREAHVLEPGVLDLWLRTAAAILRPGGGVSVIARPDALDDLIASCRGRFGGLRLIPVHPRPGQDAIRIIVSAMRGSRKRFSIAMPLILHGETGHSFTAQADCLINGEASLLDD